MRNFKIIIQYEGTRYQGWEHQPSTDMTIQGKMENVLFRMTDRQIEVIGAGRTDAGVHARAMTANALIDTELNADEIRDYMNRYLPDDICIREVKEASERFAMLMSKAAESKLTVPISCDVEITKCWYGEVIDV